MLDTTLSFTAPFIAFLPAEAIHSSGVLAVVVTGLLLGHKAPTLQSATSRLAESTNWATVQFLLENAVFLLIGLQVKGLVEDVADTDLSAARVAADLRDDPRGDDRRAVGLRHGDHGPLRVRAGAAAGAGRGAGRPASSSRGPACAAW